jgi:cytochrome b
MARIADVMPPPVHAPAKGVNWDPVIRVTHWVVAVSVLLDAVIIEEESRAHIWIGYAVLAMLALRVLWGFVGPEEARFSSFTPSLSKAKDYALGMLRGEHPEQRSHNPVGTFMVYALWGTLAVVIGTGIAIEAFHLHQMEEIHEVAANLVLVLAFAHVCGVFLESRLSGVNLVRNMTTRTESRGPE